MKFTVFNKKTKPLLGIDIGSTSIKAVYLQPQTDGFLILGCAHENIIGNAFMERSIQDFDAISNSLKKNQAPIADSTGSFSNCSCRAIGYFEVNTNGRSTY